MKGDALKKQQISCHVSCLAQLYLPKVSIIPLPLSGNIAFAKQKYRSGAAGISLRIPHDFQGIWRSWGISRSHTAIHIYLQPLLPIPVALVGGQATMRFAYFTGFALAIRGL